MFSRLLVLVLLTATSITYAAEDTLRFRDQRVGAGYLYLNQNSGGDVSTANLIYDFNFLSCENFLTNGSAFVTSYKDSSSDNTFWISSYRLTGSYKFSDNSFLPQIYAGYELWDGRGLRFEYGAGIEYSLHQFPSVKSWIDSLLLQVGQINHSDQVTVFNLGFYKNF